MNLLTAHEVAEHYKVSVDTIYRWISKGLFRGVVRIGTGKRYRIPEDSLSDAVVHTSGPPVVIEKII